MHTILCRGWKSRPKGRDWYVQRGYELDLYHLSHRLTQDVKCFIFDENELNIWSKDFFKEITKMIKEI